MTGRRASGPGAAVKRKKKTVVIVIVTRTEENDFFFFFGSRKWLVGDEADERFLGVATERPPRTSVGRDVVK